MPRTRELRTWFMFDEVHALHKLPAIEHGLQTARGFGGAFVLGMHSFDKLAETYGEQGAVNLASLARTKLILATADIETAQKCADFIGNREVRQMDEAYSYGYNNSRDASTLTPRKVVEPLVIPDDITNLPSMHGFVKFPDGFPAARIKLAWQSYPEVAPGFLRTATMTPAKYKPPEGEDAEGEDGGLGVKLPGPLPHSGPDGQAAMTPLSEAEAAAEAMMVEDPSREIPSLAREAETRERAADDDEDRTAAKAALKPNATAHRAADELARIKRAGKGAARAVSLDGRPGERNPATRVNGAAPPPVEDQMTRETRQGVGIEEAHRRSLDHGDGMEM